MSTAGENRAADETVAALRAAITGTARVERLVHLTTAALEPGELLVAARIVLAPDLELRQVAEAIDEAAVAIRSAVPTAKPIYLEPEFSFAPLEVETHTAAIVIKGAD